MSDEPSEQGPVEDPQIEDAGAPAAPQETSDEVIAAQHSAQTEDPGAAADVDGAAMDIPDFAPPPPAEAQPAEAADAAPAVAEETAAEEPAPVAAGDEAVPEVADAPAEPSEELQPVEAAEAPVEEAVEESAAPEEPVPTEEPAAATESAAELQPPAADEPSAEEAPPAPQEPAAEEPVEPPAPQEPVAEEPVAVEEAVESLASQEPVAAEAPVEPAAAQEQVAEEPAVEPEATAPAEDEPEEVATATVKFQLLPSKEVVTSAATLSQTVSELTQQLSKEIKVPAAVLQLSHAGNALPDSAVLKELGVAPNGTIQLDVTSADPGAFTATKSRADTSPPDVITVRVIRENNTVEDVVVEVERAPRKKPFLGGFRHKLTGVEYHNASAQTRPKAPRVHAVDRYNRDSQTTHEANNTSQTTSTSSTQMTKIGCYVSVMGDKRMAAGEYTTYQQYFDRRLKAVIVLQAYFRRWQARNVVRELMRDRDRRIEWERQEEIRKRREKEQRIRREFERRMNPKTKEDFDLVYAALEKWRLEEMSRIDAELQGAARKAALCALLEQETQLIASIGKHKLDANRTNKQDNIQRFLDKAAAPKRWKAYDGRYTEMDTQFTIRAKEMRDIYNSITMQYLTQDERLDVLLTLKHTVKEHDCKLTREIIELIDREADLLMRGVSDSNLEGLRQRINTLFLQYCKNPLFNPEAARLLKVPQDPSSLRKDIYFCTSANEYLPSTEFKIQSNSRSTGKCRKVQELDNIARTRRDFSYYRVMLRNLRRTEEGYKDDSKIAYLMQEKDLQYLVENVWVAQSILSAWDDLYDLELVRWDKTEEWSPWNCILLTKDEAMSHQRLDHLNEAYGQVFVNKIRHKHTLARIYFSKLPGMSEQLRRKAGTGKLAPNVLRGNALSAH